MFYFQLFERDGVVFGPVVEKPNKIAFITEEPIDMILNGSFYKLPILATYTDNETLLQVRLGEFVSKLGKPWKSWAFEPQDILPSYYKSKMNDSDFNKICSEIKRVYSSFNDSFKTVRIILFHSMRVF